MMHPKSPKWLHDILEACDVIQSAVQGRSLPDYESDRLLRSAVERNYRFYPLAAQPTPQLHDWPTTAFMAMLPRM